MEQEMNTIAFSLIIIGTVFSIGREYLARFYLWIYGRLNRRKYDERAQKGIQLYLMLTGMLFTLLGLLGFFKIVKM